MKKFLGLVFVTGIVRKPKLQLCWSTRGIFRSPIFPQTTSRNRFQLIQRYLHFYDNVSSPSSSSDESQGSSRTATPTPTKRAPKNDPPGRLDGKLKSHKLVHIPPTKKMLKCQHENVESVCAKILRKKRDFSVISVVFQCIQKAATHCITR